MSLSSSLDTNHLSVLLIHSAVNAAGGNGYMVTPGGLKFQIPSAGWVIPTRVP